MAESFSEPDRLTQNEQDLLAILAWFYLQNGQSRKALSLIKALQILCPEYPDITLRLALVQTVSDEPLDALNSLSIASFSEETQADFQLLKLQAQVKAGRIEEARDTKQQYISLKKAQTKTPQK